MTKDASGRAGLLCLFVAVYMVSYITRINFGAVIEEVSAVTGFGRATLSLALTGAFAAYGAGQIFSGWLSDRLEPKKVALAGLLASAAMNLLLPLCGAFWMMLVLWCVNGLAQAMIWPPLVRLMTYVFPPEAYGRASVTVGWGSALGTIAVYLVSPLLLVAAGWKSVFWCAGACGLVMAAVWQRHCCAVPPVQSRQAAGHSAGGGFPMPALMGLIMLAIILQGALRDGVTTWLPSCMTETYGISRAGAVLSGVVLPVFTIACLAGANALYSRVLPNLLLCAGVLFAVGAAAAFGMYAAAGESLAVSVALAALLTGCMHGVNQMLVVLVPAAFRARGGVALVSGVLNACTYVGSALSTYGAARISEQVGWGATVCCWGAAAVAGAVLCLSGRGAWAKLVRRLNAGEKSS